VTAINDLRLAKISATFP
jgi:hypothetical protein